MKTDVPMARLPAVRLPAEVMPRLDRLAAALQASLPGVTITRADALKAAIVSGLQAEEARLGLTSTPTPKGKKGKVAAPKGKG
jgi:hypothetical protein